MSEVLAQLEKKGGESTFEFVLGGLINNSDGTSYIVFDKEFFKRFSKVKITKTYGANITWVVLKTTNSQAVAGQDTALTQWNTPSGNTYDLSAYKSQYQDYVCFEYFHTTGVQFVKFELS